MKLMAIFKTFTAKVKDSNQMLCEGSVTQKE